MAQHLPLAAGEGRPILTAPGSIAVPGTVGGMGSDLHPPPGEYTVTVSGTEEIIGR